MLLAPNRRRTRRRISSFKRGVSSKDYCSHIKLDGWKNAYLSANPDLIPFEGRGRKPAAELSENQRLGFLHRLKGYILARVAAGNDYRHGDTSSELNAISRQTENSPTIPDDSTGFEASQFAQKTLFFLGVAERGFRFAIYRPTLFANIVCVRFACQK
jgi:hypothetical protein